MEGDPSDTQTLWIIDTSLSMNVEDIASNQSGMVMSRLDLAKDLMIQGRELIPGKHAVISYAREAVVEIPFTDDKNYFQNVVSHIASIGLYGGSDLSSAFGLMKLLYAEREGKIDVIVLTDGGSTRNDIGGALPPSFRVSYIGIGTPHGGKIPLGYNAFGEKRYKYYSGSEVIVRYEGENLEKLSARSDSKLYHFTSHDSFPLSFVHPEYRSFEKTLILSIATLCLLFGYFYHPYAKKR